MKVVLTQTTTACCRILLMYTRPPCLRYLFKQFRYKLRQFIVEYYLHQTTTFEADLQCTIMVMFNEVDQLLTHIGIQNITFRSISSSFWFFPRFPVPDCTGSTSLARHITQPSILLRICLVPRFHFLCRKHTRITDLRNQTGCVSILLIIKMIQENIKMTHLRTSILKNFIFTFAVIRRGKVKRKFYRVSQICFQGIIFANRTNGKVNKGLTKRLSSHFFKKVVFLDKTLHDSYRFVDLM